jgi:hypothetical protein
VGNDGEQIVADSSTSTGLRYTANFAAGKNKIINGDFGIWQRGTSFTNPTSGTYTCDRFYQEFNGTGATRTISQQTFSPGTAPVLGYEGTYFYRYAVSVAGTGNTYQAFYQKIEDVRIFANQTVTISFWAKASGNVSINPIEVYQDFGTGGSAGAYATTTGSYSVTTSWQRFTTTFSMPSISGKTVGTNSSVRIGFYMPSASTIQFDMWGIQFEAGPVVTAFQTATGTLQGELAACQRYYQVIGGVASSYPLMGGYSISGSNLYTPTSFVVQMRTSPTVTKNGTWEVFNVGQPSGIYISQQGMSYSLTSTATGAWYSHPNSTDDTFTISAEL